MYSVYLQREDFVIVQSGHLFLRQGSSCLVTDLKTCVELQHVQQLQRGDNNTSYFYMWKNRAEVLWFQHTIISSVFVSAIVLHLAEEVSFLLSVDETGEVAADHQVRVIQHGVEPTPGGQQGLNTQDTTFTACNKIPEYIRCKNNSLSVDGIKIRRAHLCRKGFRSPSIMVERIRYCTDVSRINWLHNDSISQHLDHDYPYILLIHELFLSWGCFASYDREANNRAGWQWYVKITSRDIIHVLAEACVTWRQVIGKAVKNEMKGPLWCKYNKELRYMLMNWQPKR